MNAIPSHIIHHLKINNDNIAKINNNAHPEQLSNILIPNTMIINKTKKCSMTLSSTFIQL